MFSTLQSLRDQLSSLFGGSNSGPPQFGANVSPTGATYPTAENTSLDWNPAEQRNGGAGSSGFGLNSNTLGLGLNGLQALGSFLQGNKAYKLASDQFDFTKGITNTNLNNSIKSYNTALEDRLRARGVTEGTDPAVVQSNIARNRLSR